jgi:BirA family biotin operon repressor/biotin-[acetyl-CoA-carboxylase] ligase
MLTLKNPFGSPVYYKETVVSTMDEGRILAAAGAAAGTVITAGEQTAGRGRAGRPWQSSGGNLFFTVLLRFEDFFSLPKAITLRTGLAVSLAVEDFAPALCGKVTVKWPNDIMIGRRKLAGILTEANGPNVLIGVGVNVGQKEFPAELRNKATSLAMETSIEREKVPGAFLEAILARLYSEIFPSAGSSESPGWRERLEERLYLRGQRVRFIDGAAGSGHVIEGVLAGIDPAGGLLLESGGTAPKSFITGELDVY